MNKETAINLIKTGKLELFEIKKVLNENSEYDVVREAVERSFFSDEELIKLAENHKSSDDWAKPWFIKQIKDKKSHDIWNILDRVYKEIDNKYEFESLATEWFDFESMSATLAIKTGRKILRRFPYSARRIFKAVLKNKKLNKKQLLLIGDIARDMCVWDDVINRLNLKTFSKRALFSLSKKKFSPRGSGKRKDTLSKDIRLKLLQAAKPPLRKLIPSLKSCLRYSNAIDFRDQLITFLVDDYKVKPEQYLKIAREMQNEGIWYGFGSKFSGYSHLLTKRDKIRLLRRGYHYWQNFLIHSLDVNTLRRLVIPGNSKEELEDYIIRDILASKRISKQLTLKTAQRKKSDQVSVGLIQSGHFIDTEIIELIQMEVMYANEHVWKVFAGTLDLKKFDFDKLFEIGKLADSSEIWEKITEVIKARRKKRTSSKATNQNDTAK